MVGMPLGGMMSMFGMSTAEDDPDTIAKKAKAALAKGVQDGGGVTQVKMHTDQTGANGSNDYFSALGYDA